MKPKYKDVKFISHNLGNVNPDDPSFGPFLLTFQCRIGDMFMAVAAMSITNGAHETVKIRGKTREALEAVVKGEGWEDHPRKVSIEITEPEKALADRLPEPDGYKSTMESAEMRFLSGRPSHCYCGICGHVPEDAKAEPNRAPLRWWDPDDGWKIGALCRGCAKEFLDAKPKPSDYAFDSTNGVADDIDTDEDPIEAI